MSLYAGAILLTELLMVAMMYHVAYYPGFTRVEKRWYLLMFISVFFCAGAEFVAKQFDSCGPSFALPLTILTVLQFSLSPMLPVFSAGRSDYTDPPSSWERRSVYTRWRRAFSPHSA